MATQEKLQIGTVVSNKMDKTVVVRIDRYKRHRLYGKSMKVTQRYKAHDENNECRLGDIVRISETRPLSREKRWRSRSNSLPRTPKRRARRPPSDPAVHPAEGRR